jgi:hypothetical protein
MIQDLIQLPLTTCTTPRNLLGVYTRNTSLTLLNLVATKQVYIHIINKTGT